MTWRAHGNTALAMAVLLMSCGAEPAVDGSPGDETFVAVEVELPDALGPVIPIRLDTAELDRRVRAELPVLLPFVRSGRRLVAESFLLQAVPLRAPGLTDAILKDGRREEFRRIALGAAGSYQGRPPAKRGSAAATVTPQALEANMLLAEGWSIVEPLEPLLRLHGISPVEQEEILAVANHVAYHTTDLEQHFEFRDDPGFSGDDESPWAAPKVCTTVNARILPPRQLISGPDPHLPIHLRPQGSPGRSRAKRGRRSRPWTARGRRYPLGWGQAAFSILS